MRRGSAAPTRTPMACCASTYPRALTCRCSRKPNSTPSPPGSTAGRARRLALRHPMRCSPRWWTRPPTPSRHEMRRVFVMELESAAGLPESQSPGMEAHIHRHGMYGRCPWNRTVSLSSSELFLQGTTVSEIVQGDEQDTYVALGRSTRTDTGSPESREAYGDGVVIVVRGQESRPHGEGPQVSDDRSIEVAAMARAENIRVIYSDLSEECHWKAGRHRKSHIRFG